jgi:sugar-specific transcriptional regulator TrmB
MFETELKDLGLTDNEVKIYLTLIREGILNPTKLAEKTGLHRSYVYDTLERLLEKGVINTILVDNKKNFQAIDPKVLREQFEIKIKQMDSILPQLSTLFQSKQEGISVELHKGKRVYKTLIQDLVSNLKNKDTVCITGIDESILEQIEPIYLKQYFTILKEKKVNEKIIIKKGTKKFTEKSINYRVLDGEYLGDTATVIYQNKVYLFINGEPNYLIIIKGKSIAESYKKNFELLWKLAKE